MLVDINWKFGREQCSGDPKFDIECYQDEEEIVYVKLVRRDGWDFPDNDLTDPIAIAQRIDTGLYWSDLNLDSWLELYSNLKLIQPDYERRTNLPIYGICDTVEQAIEEYKEVLNDPLNKYVMSFTKIRKEDDEPNGWRWCKWGEYIGTQSPQAYYLYDEPEIEQVLVFEIFRVVEIK